MYITLLRVIPRKENNFAAIEHYLRGWCQHLAEQGVSAGYEIIAGSAADQIIDYAAETATDLIAMTTHGQTTVNTWPLGSVAQKVLLAGTSPLFLVKE